jgi:RNA polymerase sigma factor (TIGR02999 family)
MSASAGEITRLLERYRLGDRDAEAALFQCLHAELHRLAVHYLRGEQRQHTLQPTALINEAYVRLIAQHDKTFANRSHFVAVAATVMRHVLVDCARRAHAEKRGFGLVADPVDEQLALRHHDPAELLDLDRALTRLAERDPRQARVVELRYFSGLSIEETAEALGISPRTVKREWTMARAWLWGELNGTPSSGPAEHH